VRGVRLSFGALSVLAAIGAVVAAALVQPVPGDPDHLMVFGRQIQHVCPILASTGSPCASCGMTRAWVWAVRGDLALALRYNAAGVALLAAIVANGALRGWLLNGGSLPRRAWAGAVLGAAAWVVLWLGGWGLRLAGLYPMP